MGKIVAFTNRKGGTAKTTTVANLGVVLASMGKKVLLVDLDPQGNLSVNFGFSPFNTEKPNIFELFHDKAHIKNLVETEVRANLDILTADDRLDDIREFIANKPRREDYLRKALNAIRNDYDFILIDCNPSTDVLTMNAFSASDSVVIPMATDYFAMSGVSQVLIKVRSNGAEVNPDLKVLGILLTRFDTRTNESKRVVEETKTSLAQHFRVFDTVIREGVKTKEAPRYSKSVAEYQPDYSTAEDYRNFALEFLKYVQE